MTDTKKKYAEKRLIHVTKEQEERMAAESHAKVQAHVNELNQVQSRRFELSVGLLIAEVTRAGFPVDNATMVANCRALASEMVEADARQKWTDLKALFEELGVRGPQDALEWGAKQRGVTLFDPLPERPESLIVAPTIEAIEKVSH